MKRKHLFGVLVLVVIILMFFSGTGVSAVSAIYDVTGDGIVDFEDAALTWYYRTPQEVYDELYDVNSDGVVDFEDAALVWYNIGEVVNGGTILDWIVDIIWG